MWGVTVGGELPVDTIVKISNALITALWVHADSATTWAYVDQHGWRKLANASLLTAAAVARTTRSKCTLTLRGDQIIEMYVL